MAKSKTNSEKGRRRKVGTGANLTPVQTAIAADIPTNTNTVSIGGVQTAIKDVPHTQDNAFAVAAWYNQTAAGPYWVWKTSIMESEITRQPSVDGTVWSWPAYIARSVGEQNAWARLFMGGGSGMIPGLANVRQGLADIFSGTANNAPAQRTHLLAICRRQATWAEKLVAVAVTGPGNDGIAANRGLTSNPDFLSADVTVSDADVRAVWNI